MNFKFLLSIFCFSLAISAIAQEHVNDPLTSYGIGESSDGFHPTFQAIGNTTSVQLDSSEVNFYNPSSYSNIAKGQPVFAIGINNSVITYKDNGVKENGVLTQISHFAFGMSFAKIVGFSFGLRPFTRTGYHVTTTQVLDEETSMKNRYDGEGNTNLFYGGFSVNALNLKQHKLGLGINLGYLFGSIINKQSSYLDVDGPTNKGSVYSTTHYLNAFEYEIGANYQLLLDNDRLLIGSTYRPKQKLNARYIYEKAYATNIDNMDNFAFLSSDVTKGTITLPEEYSIGIQYQLYTKRNRQNVKLDSKITLSTQFKHTKWSDYRGDFGDLPTIQYGYHNTQTYGVGIEYIPQHKFLERVETGYLSKVRYRIGGSFANLPYANGDYQVQSYAVGFGFPFFILRSTSSINFSVSYNRNYDAGNSNAFQKNFVNFSLGITFAPGINDRWFRKYKID